MIENALKVFSFGQMRDAATLLGALEKHEISTDDFLAYVAEEQRRRVREGKRIERRRSEILERLPKCPSCGSAMVLRPAGPDPEDGSHWTCPDCRLGQFDERPVGAIRKSLGLDK
jgi:hypothetical protein